MDHQPGSVTPSDLSQRQPQEHSFTNSKAELNESRMHLLQAGDDVQAGEPPAAASSNQSSKKKKKKTPA